MKLVIVVIPCIVGFRYLLRVSTPGESISDMTRSNEIGLAQRIVPLVHVRPNVDLPSCTLLCINTPSASASLLRLESLVPVTRRLDHPHHLTQYGPAQPYYIQQPPIAQAPMTYSTSYRRRSSSLGSSRRRRRGNGNSCPCCGWCAGAALAALCAPCLCCCN
ncbi:hypothetical protein SISNIDRAFT_135675 [Sistotremastrum niveocremeum HHB9708]|uniref:Cysteine-rich transmembrane CYSTM domain-containing protein n=1 Tax=Sistotremastrum niveocremeum HHB9708 TaxID=1314777 RepID=A0A164ZY82_9AGAM|nr:hypothetical protein SISNIDRAFT_135675 [Sistotremastrum niveocremeum HHB9708]